MNREEKLLILDAWNAKISIFILGCDPEARVFIDTPNEKTFVLESCQGGSTISSMIDRIPKIPGIEVLVVYSPQVVMNYTGNLSLVEKLERESTDVSEELKEKIKNLLKSKSEGCS